MSLRAEAISNLTELLRRGGTVAGCSFRDLLDCEADRSREPDSTFLADLDTLIRCDDTAESFASSLFEKITARYLSSKHCEDAVNEEIAEIIHDAEVEA